MTAITVYTIREWTSGKLISHQFTLDDADLDARIHACETMRRTFVTDNASHIVSVFDLNGNRIAAETNG